MPAKKQPPVKPAAKPVATKDHPEAKVDRTLNLDQLSGKVRELRQDLIRHLNQIRAGATGNVRRPGQIRRQIARHLTVTSERLRQKPDQTVETKSDQPLAAKTETKTEIKPKAATKPKPKAKKQRR